MMAIAKAAITCLVFLCRRKRKASLRQPTVL